MPLPRIDVVTAAIFGLIGVLVGGVLNGVVSYWLDSRRDAKGAKVAARLLADDFAWYSSMAGTINDGPRWPTEPGAHFRFSNETWGDQRTLLAAAISKDDWLTVAAASHYIDYGEVIVASAVPGGDIDPQDRARLSLIEEKLAEGMRLLEPYIG